MTETEQLHAKLKELFPSDESLETWLKTPNNAFYGCSPAQLIEEGKTDLLWRMIYFIESGNPS